MNESNINRWENVLWSRWCWMTTVLFTNYRRLESSQMDYRNGKKKRKKNNQLNHHQTVRRFYLPPQIHTDSVKETQMPRHSKVEHIRVSVCQRRLNKKFCRCVRVPRYRLFVLSLQFCIRFFFLFLSFFILSDNNKNPMKVNALTGKHTIYENGESPTKQTSERPTAIYQQKRKFMLPSYFQIGLSLFQPWW